MRSARAFLVLVLVSVTFLSSVALAQTYVQLILDASGSMFNKLDDGRYRIVAAKEVLTDLIGALPADGDLNVGLRVYGSQGAASETGSCEDSLLLVPMAGVDRGRLLDTVRDVQARGATPIARSLELAGEDFPASGRHVIVLVTDGEESCGGDPGAVLDALRARGIDVDLRVVGIDLSPRAEASFEGLGTFENARNAAELAAALARAVEQVAEVAPAAYETTVLVVRDGLPADDGVVVALIGAISEEISIATRVRPGAYTLALPAGAFRAEVEDAFSDGVQPFTGLTVTPEGPNVFTFELASAVAVDLTVAPAEPVAGATVTVTFAGAPAGEGHWITVVPVDAPDGTALAWSEVRGATGDAVLPLPHDAATFEARYHLRLPEGGSRVIGRSEPFTSRELEVRVEAPAEVGAGERFEVLWTGPDASDDYVTIVPQGARDGAYLSYAYTSRGNPAVLTAPVTPGAYEVRYGSDGSGGRVFARAPVSVTPQAYALQAPAEAAAGGAFTVTWTGPGNEGDYITIVPEGAPVGSYESYAYTRSGNPANLRAPLAPGRYEVRYSTEQQRPNPTLASVPIIVTAAAYDLAPPAEVATGSSFEVTWKGPDNQGDYLTIVPQGAPVGSYASYAYTRSGNPARLSAPATPGTYEVRYSTEQQSPNPTLASVTVRVVDAVITLDAPDVVAVDTPFVVTWTGPDGPSDYLTIVPMGSPDGAYLSYSYTVNGPTLELTAPSEPGAYEIRYASDRVSGTFARRPITVR